MRKQLLGLALITIARIEAYPQISFENGYFIDDSNYKTECLIKNVDWRNNPTAIEYKLSPDVEVQTATIETIKEFGINNGYKYIKAKTNIDRSSDQINKMSSDVNPSFEEELLFLKVLIEGQASLFLYNDGSLTRFFYKLNDSEINQLVYKRFLKNKNVIENNFFRQQIFQNLKCEEIVFNDIEHIQYAKGDLERLFIKYNESIGSGYINHELKQEKDVFNLSLRPGVNYSSLEIQNSQSNSADTDFEKEIAFRFGVEAEFVLPFNKNKWGIIIEPTYQYFKSEQSRESSDVAGGILVTNVNYESIELPMGLRHYFYLNDRSKLFANISIVLDFAFNSNIEFLREDGSMFKELEIKSGEKLAFGIGYKYGHRYGLEIRYNTNRNIVSDYKFWSADYRTFSIVFGYSLF